MISACGLVCVTALAEAQDLSRYRDIAFGSSVASVVASTGTNVNAVKVAHQRPAVIQELAWRPQYAVTRALSAPVEAVQEVTFRFYNDQLFSITVVYEPRLVKGLTNHDIIDAVSEVYGPATLTFAAANGPLSAPAGTLNASTPLARWQAQDHQFTLLGEVYPATYRLIGVSMKLETLARAAETEAARLDKQEAPRREAEQAAADAEREAAAAEKARTTNKGEFRP